MTEPRHPDFPVHPQFAARWSPRAFDATPVTQDELMTLFEAARWAPSAFNAQPWRLLYAHRDTPDWDRFLGLLAPFNQGWARQAGVLLFVLSDTIQQSHPQAEPKPSHSHSFDAGAAWAMLALQATAMGLFTHGMTGVDFAAVRTALAMPDRYRIECAIAIGHIGDPATLPDALRGREAPSGRNPVSAFAFSGNFPADGGTPVEQAA